MNIVHEVLDFIFFLRDSRSVCWRCGHTKELHMHYRTGTDCSQPGCETKNGQRCSSFR